jgi:outer membrane lipoprotein-sorting protein
MLSRLPAAAALVICAPGIVAAASPKHPSDIPSGQEVVAAADRVRNPGEPFRVTLTLIEYDNGKPRNRTVLVVYAKEDQPTEQFHNLVRYAEPRRDAGKLVLFTASNLWFFDPASQASIRISPQQRFSGQASDGDVLTVNLTRDFAAQVVGAETLQDADRQDRDCWRLDMAAAAPEAIYNRIEYWVDRATSRPVKAKFYADSGRLLKIAYYHKYEERLGADRPTQIILIDAVNGNLATTIDYSDYRFQSIPDAWFQRDYLPRLKPE